MRHKCLVLAVKTWLKSVYIYGSYRKIKTGVPLFWTTGVYCTSASSTILVPQYYHVLLLFSYILLSHIHHHLLPLLSAAFQNYELRHRIHNRSLPDRAGHLSDANFISRTIIKTNTE